MPGLSLAVEMVKGKRQVWSLTIGVDSQAVMHATGHRRAIPGQHLVEAFHEQVAAVWSKHPGIKIRMRWTPGHKGIQGNKRVDEEANRVAKGELSEHCSLPMMRRGELLASGFGSMPESQEKDQCQDRGAVQTLTQMPKALAD